MPNYTIHQIILTHQPVSGTLNSVLWCRCGQFFSGQHQIDMLESDGHDTN